MFFVKMHLVGWNLFGNQDVSNRILFVVIELMDFLIYYEQAMDFGITGSLLLARIMVLFTRMELHLGRLYYALIIV